jgi:4-amino-4-deoxy-L-arabinose transferase-like glycosyltransferase
MKALFRAERSARSLPPSRNKSRLKPELLWLALAALILALLFQGNRGLWGPDEGRFSNVALHMLESGDWLVPKRHPEHIELARMPMTYWAVASSVKVFGREEWALRLPSALAFVGTVLLTYLLSRRMMRRRPWLPPVLYMTNLVPFFAANLLTADSLMCLFQTLGVYGYVLMWQSESARAARQFRCLMWGGFALAFLCKGIPALLPLFALLVYRRVSGLKFPVSMIGYDGPLLFLAIVLPWFALLSWRIDVPLSMLWGSAVKLSPEINAGPWTETILVYGPVLLSFLLPWGLIALVLAATQYREPLRAYFQRLKWERFRQIHQESVFLQSWVFIPIIVFMLFRAKLWLYALPLLVPLSIAIGRALQGIRLRMWMAILLAAWMLTLLAVKGFAPRYNQSRDARELAQLLQSHLPEAKTELYFLDQTPVYGLKFYLGHPLKRISSKAQPDAVDDALWSALTSAQVSSALWLIPIDRMPEFAALAGQRGFAIAKRTALLDYVALQVRMAPNG